MSDITLQQCQLYYHNTKLLTVPTVYVSLSHCTIPTRLMPYYLEVRIVFYLGVIPGSHGYIQVHKNVYMTRCGRSFYKQCLPDASVYLAFSSLAVMWPSAW